MTYSTGTSLTITASPIVFKNANSLYSATQYSSTGYFRYQCTNKQQTVAITTPVVTDAAFDIGTEVGTTSILFSPYYLNSGQCTGIIKFTLTVSPASSQINWLSTASSPTVSWQTLTQVGTYTITVVGTIGNGQTTTLAPTLTVTNICSSSSLSASTVADQTYTISQSALAVSIPAFISSPSNCVVIYTITHSNGTALNPYIFNFSTPPPVLTIYNSSYNGWVGHYTFLVKGIFVFNSVSATTTFKVTINH